MMCSRPATPEETINYHLQEEARLCSQIDVLTQERDEAREFLSHVYGLFVAQNDSVPMLTPDEMKRVIEIVASQRIKGHNQ